MKYQKRDTFPQKKGKIIDELRLIQYIIMEYQKIANLIDDTSNQPSKFRTKKLG